MKTKENALELEFHPFSPTFLCEQQGEEERWKEDYTYTTSTRYWLQPVTYHSLDTYENWRCSMENRIWGHVWLKKYFKFPITYQTLNSPSKLAELKPGLMHKCTTFSASSLFCRFLMSALSGSTSHYITSSNTISSDRTSEQIDCLIHSIHSVFAENPNSLKSRTRAPKSIPCIFTLRKCTLS